MKKKTFFNEDGHITDIHIALTSDRLAAGKEDQIPESVMNHFEECELCRHSAFDTFCSTLSTNRPEIPVPGLFIFPEKPEKRRMPRMFMRAAATFLAAILVSVIYIMIDSRQPVRDAVNVYNQGKTPPEVSPVKPSAGGKQGQSGIQESDPEKEIKSGISLRHNPFKDNPNLEYMVDSPQRGRMIQIISPEFKIMKKGKIIFRWENHIDKDLQLKILNNVNETLYTLRAKNSKVEFTGQLSPGLYYWKLEDDETLYHVGKFVIE